MTRLARVVAVGVPHHVTQRGNARRFILNGDADRRVYLDLLRQSIELHSLTLIGYCLMFNHIHLIVTPGKLDSLARSLKDTHGRYAGYWNPTHRSSGHVWQGRFYSCPLDEVHVWEALRYTELNPVRAGLVDKAENWEWSSACAHCGTVRASAYLEMESWRARWSVCEWRTFLAAREAESELTAIRNCTYTGRPLGAREFIRKLERETNRSLTVQKRGRPRKVAIDERVNQTTQCIMPREQMNFSWPTH
jgi:putative transposase